MSGHFALFAALLLAGTAGCTPEPSTSAAEQQADVQEAPVQQGGVQRAPEKAALQQTGAQVADGEYGVFFCPLGGGKLVTVGKDGERYRYRYGTARQAELTIEGTPTNGRLFVQSELHGGEHMVELRFVSGAYSYVVHSFPRSDIVDNVPTSGLRVYQGNRMITDRSCSPWAELSDEDFNSFETLPRVPLGSPDIWESSEAAALER